MPPISVRGDRCLRVRFRRVAKTPISEDRGRWHGVLFYAADICRRHVGPVGNQSMFPSLWIVNMPGVSYSHPDSSLQMIRSDPIMIRSGMAYALRPPMLTHRLGSSFSGSSQDSSADRYTDW